MKIKTLLLAAVLVVIIGGGYMMYNALSGSAPPPERLGGGDDAQRIQAADFTVKDQAGNDVNLSDFIGKPIVLNFWASWCPPCRSEMPEFDKVFEELGDTVQFLMVNATGARGETAEAGAEYVAKEGFAFPVFYDLSQDAVTVYGIRAFPTSIFIDSEGYIAAGVEGAIDEQTLRRGIALISEQ